MPRLLFSAPILPLSLNPYIIAPACAAALKPNRRKPLPVLARINMMSKGDGSFYLYLHEQMLKASNTKVGGSMKFELAFDGDEELGSATTD